jgi:2',3'-cyclic-nucleotide 2'-phosphodiesterase
VNILYIGDIMGQPGIDVVERVLPELKKQRKIDLIIAQAENVSGGKGMTLADMRRLQDLGLDFFTGGNHTPTQPEIHQLLEDETAPVIGPANMPECPGKGWKYVDTPKGRVLVVSLLGLTVGRAVITTNPLAAIDKILDENRTVERVATIVNFHGDYSSEKRVIGYYLDGRVTAVIGDHWHVPTADAMVLPKGTAHMTDVGMCGSLHSSLGVKLESIVGRWRDGRVTRNELETEQPFQFNAALTGVDTQTGSATSIKHIQKLIHDVQNLIT